MNIKMLVSGHAPNSSFLLLSSNCFMHAWASLTCGSIWLYTLAPPSYLTSFAIGNIPPLCFPSHRAGLSMALCHRQWLLCTHEPKALCSMLPQTPKTLQASTIPPSQAHLRGSKRIVGSSSVLTKD